MAVRLDSAPPDREACVAVQLPGACGCRIGQRCRAAGVETLRFAQGDTRRNGLPARGEPRSAWRAGGGNGKRGLHGDRESEHQAHAEVASRAHRPVSTSAGGRPADGKGDLSDPAGSIVLGRLRTSESVRCRSERRESVRKVRHSDHPPLELGHALVEFDAALLE